MPLMMIGTPGRPGMTRSNPSPAKAAGVTPIKRANAVTMRMGVLFRFVIDNLHQCPQPVVKAGRLLGGKANAKPLTTIRWGHASRVRDPNSRRVVAESEAAD